MSGTVLILDDSLTVRMDLTEAFAAAGFRTEPCATAAEARDLLAREPVDVVILDVLLPDADGIDFLREIRTATPSSAAVVVMVSTEANVRDRIRGLQTGADEYIGKPYDTGYVVAKVQDLLRARTDLAADVTTVLVIDDSLTFRETLRTAFEEAGYRVLTARSGDEGLRVAAGARPSAIVVDDVLPGIDGATVIRRIRLDAALRGVPCLLLTASEDRGAELRAFDAGADAFERKAGDVGVILAKLAALLRRVTSVTPTDRTASVLGPKKILAVDDSMAHLQQLDELLRTEGYDLVLARSGEEALEVLAVEAVDCILLDLLMPGLSGQETCRLIKSAPVVRDIPLIVLTALEDREAMIQALAAGADDYIPKSIEFAVLTARIRTQMRRKQFEDEHRQIREELLRKELEAADAEAARRLAETRAALVGELERKNQELEAARAEAEGAWAEAERASGAKTEFLSRMSHELRTPLNAILGFAQLLEIEDLGSEHGESVEHILRAGRHLLQLIDEVLDVARIEQGRLSLSIEPVHLDEVVGEALDLIRPLAVSAHIGARVEASQFHRHVLADRQRLKQVLMNLLSNAVKYNREGGTVSLSCDLTPAGRLRIGVADTGPGIPPPLMDRLFLPFERLGAERTPVEGTGIGLSISKRLAELMGGEIGAESEVGRGSTFWVELDVAEAPEERDLPTSDGTETPPAPAAERTVLYVEDNLSNFRLVERILARRPTVRLVAAVQGALALDLARRHRPDLILLDVHLPDIGGDEVLRRLQADPETNAIPVVTVSAEATPAKIERFLMAGAHAYLTKPIDVTRFLEVVDEILGEPMPS